MNILKMKIFTEISMDISEISTDISEIFMEIMDILIKLWMNLQRNFDGNIKKISEKLRKYRQKLWKFYPFFLGAKRYFHYLKKTKFPRNFVDNFDFFIIGSMLLLSSENCNRSRRFLTKKLVQLTIIVYTISNWFDNQYYKFID